MLKTFVKVIAGLVLLLVIAVGVFLYTFDANTYKQEISALAESVTGRPITISGDLDISVYPWIGIKVNDMTIENAPGFSNKTFATIGQLDVSIKIAPLLQRRLEVDRVVLHRPEVDFEVNAAGDKNWSDLAGATESASAESKFGFAGLSVAALDLKDARLTWRDRTTGKEFRVSKMSLGTQAIQQGRPLPVEFKALVESSQPEWMAVINAKTELVFSDNSAVFEARGLKASAKALLPGTKIGKLKVAMVADGVIDLQSQSARLANAKLGMLGMVIAGTFDVEQLFSVPFIQGPVRVKTFEAATLADHLKLEMPGLSSPQSLKKISLSAALKTDFSSIQLDNIAATVDETKVTGFVHVAELSPPVVRYELKADSINLDDYRPVTKPADSAEPSVMLDIIRAVELDGVIDVESATAGGAALAQLRVGTSIADGILNANPVTMRLHEGELNAAVRVSARESPAVLLTAEAVQLDAEGSINPLMRLVVGDQAPMLGGRVSADLDLRAKGFSLPALQSSAQGTLKLEIADGTLTGIDFNHISQSVVVDYAERNDFRVSRTFNDEFVPDSVTPFDELSASFKISKGRLVNKDLMMASEQLTVSGSGTIDYINGKLDYRPVIDIQVPNTGNIRDKLRDHPMMYHAHGSFGAVDVDFDVARYDLHLGRLMIQEAKAHRNRTINSQSEDSWQNALSK